MRRRRRSNAACSVTGSTARSEPVSAPRVSAALIVKDEADHLEACLARLRGVVDEIVVVDTGSSDASMDVARDAGAVVLEYPWDGSFANARNVGLDAVTGDWVLYIDADERLEAPTSAAEMRDIVAAAERERVHALHVNFTLVVGQTHAYEWRLWRHEPSIRFDGIIHESIVPAIQRALERDGASHRDTDAVRLVHLGYEGDQTRKHERNLPLLLAEAERTPNRPYLWNHLGRVLEGLGRTDEALAMWQRGIDVVRATPAADRKPIDGMCHADVLIRAAEAGRAEPELLAEGLALFPTNWVIRWAAALDAFNRRRYDEAASRAQEIIDAVPAEVHATALTYPKRLFTDWPWHLLGMCRFEQRRDAEAAVAFERAAELAPGITEYAVKARLARARVSAIR